MKSSWKYMFHDAKYVHNTLRITSKHHWNVLIDIVVVKEVYTLTCYCFPVEMCSSLQLLPEEHSSVVIRTELWCCWEGISPQCGGWLEDTPHWHKHNASASPWHLYWSVCIEGRCLPSRHDYRKLECNTFDNIIKLVNLFLIWENVPVQELWLFLIFGLRRRAEPIGQAGVYRLSL